MLCFLSCIVHFLKCSLFLRLWVSKMLKAEAQGRVVFFQKMQQKERRVELGHLSSNIRLSTCPKDHLAVRCPLTRIGFLESCNMWKEEKEEDKCGTQALHILKCLFNPFYLWLLLHLLVTLRQKGENTFSCSHSSFCVRSQGGWRSPIRSPIISGEVININCQGSPIAPWPSISN